MFHKLATSIGDGRLNTSASQSWAEAAVAEGASGEILKTWAGIAKGGESINHAERDLFRWLNLKLANVEPYLAWLPRELRDEVELKLQPTPMALPHELLHSIFTCGAHPYLNVLGWPSLRLSYSFVDWLVGLARHQAYRGHAKPPYANQRPQRGAAAAA